MMPGDLIVFRVREPGTTHAISRYPGACSQRGGDNPVTAEVGAGDMGLVLQLHDDPTEPEALVLFGQRLGWGYTTYMEPVSP